MSALTTVAEMLQDLKYPNANKQFLCAEKGIGSKNPRSGGVTYALPRARRVQIKQKFRGINKLCNCNSQARDARLRDPKAYEGIYRENYTHH